MMKMEIKASALLVAAALLGGSAIGIAAQTPQEIAAEAAESHSGNSPAVSGDSSLPSAADNPSDMDITGKTASSQNDETAPLTGMPNPLVEYGSYEAAAEVLGFSPLALPKSSGWHPAAYIVINNEIGELRFEKKWEPEISFTIRTCRLSEGEEPSDISGLYGVKWWDEEFEGQTVYTARYGERSYAAIWNIGRYVFAAYGKNMAYSRFWYLLTDNLLSQSGTYLYPDSGEQEAAVKDTSETGRP